MLGTNSLSANTRQQLPATSSGMLHLRNPQRPHCCWHCCSLCCAELTAGIVRCMGSDLTGHLALDMGPELTSSIVHSSGIKNIGRLVAQMGGGITGERSNGTPAKTATKWQRSRHWYCAAVLTVVVQCKGLEYLCQNQWSFDGCLAGHAAT